MSQKIVDLDDVVGPPREVKIDGNVYKLPADLPTELFLEITEADRVAKEAKAKGEPTSDMQELRDKLLELFQIHQPKMTKVPGGITQLVLMIPAVYFGFGQDGDEGKAKPATTRARRGKPSTSRKKTSRSRS